MSNVLVRNRFASRVPVTVSFQSDPGRAKQSMRDECDINRIMAKFQKTGVIAHVNRHAGKYGVHTGIEYREALELVRGAEAMFMDLPSKARQRFNHDPAEFMAFVSDPKNVEEMRSLGLAKPKPAEEVKPSASPEPAASGSGGNPQ